MTDHAPLTDEELARLEADYNDHLFVRTSMVGMSHLGESVGRLIADLRVARAEVQRLRTRAETAEASLRRAGAVRDQERERCNRRPCTCGHHRDWT